MQHLLHRPHGWTNYISGWRKCGAFDIIYGLLVAECFINYDWDEEQNGDDDCNNEKVKIKSTVSERGRIYLEGEGEEEEEE